MIETVFLDAVRNKNQENCKIGNRKRRQNAELKPGRNNELEREMRLRS